MQTEIEMNRQHQDLSESKTILQKYESVSVCAFVCHSKSKTTPNMCRCPLFLLLTLLFIREVIGLLINSEQFVHNKMLHFRFDIAARIIIKMIIIEY